MSIIEPAAITQLPQSTTGATSRWITAEKYVLITGVAIVALYGVARFVYEPSMHDKELAMQATMTTEHGKACDQLGKPAGAPDRDNCFKVLDALLATHRQALFADSGEI
jgi:hypothetical protein